MTPRTSKRRLGLWLLACGGIAVVLAALVLVVALHAVASTDTSSSPRTARASESRGTAGRATTPRPTVDELADESADVRVVEPTAAAPWQAAATRYEAPTVLEARDHRFTGFDAETGVEPPSPMQEPPKVLTDDEIRRGSW